MWKQIIPVLRNALMTICLVGLGMLIYNVLILRGRSFELYEYDRSELTFRSFLTPPKLEKRPLKPTTNEYRIRLLGDGRYELRLKNNSLLPYLVTMYEFKGWQYELPAPMLLNYAQRYTISSLANGESVDSGFGFDCGTGLGHSLIRPYESFTDTISGDSLFGRFSVHDFITVNEREELVDQFTRQVYGALHKFDGDNKNKLVAMMPNDSLSIRFYLPALAWTDLAYHKFESNPIKISRQALLRVQD